MNGENAEQAQCRRLDIKPCKRRCYARALLACSKGAATSSCDKLPNASKLVQRLAQTDNFKHISFCKDTSNESIDSLDERVPYVENKTILFIPVVPVFITRHELEKCIEGAEKEALATSFNSEDEDTIKLYGRVMESRTLYESDQNVAQENVLNALSVSGTTLCSSTG